MALCKVTLSASLFDAVPNHDVPFPITERCLTSAALSGMRTDAGDLRVYLDEAKTTQLPLHVAKVEGSGPVTRLVAWTPVPVTSSSVDTDIYVEYDNGETTQPAPTATYGSQAVWTGDLDAYAVWLLNEEIQGDDSTTFADATGGGSTVSLFEGSDANMSNVLGSADINDLPIDGVMGLAANSYGWSCTLQNEPGTDPAYCVSVLSVPNYIVWSGDQSWDHEINDSGRIRFTTNSEYEYWYATAYTTDGTAHVLTVGVDGTDITYRINTYSGSDTKAAGADLSSLPDVGIIDSYTAFDTYNYFRAIFGVVLDDVWHDSFYRVITDYDTYVSASDVSPAGTATGTAAGASTAEAVGAAIATSAGTASGTSTAVAVAFGVSPATGASAGTSTAAAVGISQEAAAGTSAGISTAIAGGVAAEQAYTSDPASTVKMVFVHHSCGGALIADGNGGLAYALDQRGYYFRDVSYDADNNTFDPPENATIADYTDIGHWWLWFADTTVQGNGQPRRDNILGELYDTDNKTDAFGAYTTTLSDPGGPNKIVMIKSCYPNAEVQDDNSTDPEDLYGQAYNYAPGGVPAHTLSNCKAVYERLYEYMALHPEHLFVVMVNPPRLESESDSTEGANMRALSLWMVREWLQNHSAKDQNIYVYDYYNVLTDTDAHHRVVGGLLTHEVVPGASNFLEYYVSNNHPSEAGQQKVAGEFQGVLNTWYQRWLTWVATLPAGTAAGTSTAVGVGASIAAATGTSAGTSTAAGVSGGALLWEDDFERADGPIGNNWAFVFGATATIDSGDMLRESESGPYKIVYNPAGAALPADYKLEVTVPHDNLTTPYWGIVARFDSADNTGVRVFRPSSDTLTVGNSSTYNGGNVTVTVTGGIPSSWSVEQDHTFGVELQGTSGRILLDGEEYGTFSIDINTTDTGLAVGFCGEGRSRRWRDITVTSLGASGSAAGSAEGTSTANAVGASIAAATGTAAGSSTAPGVGSSIAQATGTAVGSSTSNAVSGASGTGTGTAAGTSTAQATGASTAATDGTSEGTSTAAGVGASMAAATGTAEGASTAAAGGDFVTQAIGSAAGTSTATAVGAFTTTSTGTASGTATAQAYSAGTAQAQGIAAGTSTCTGMGASGVQATGTAAGTSAAVAQSGYTGMASGLAVVTGTASWLAAAAANANGIASVAAVALVFIAATGTAAGVCTCSGVSVTSEDEYVETTAVVAFHHTRAELQF
jgi:hypothetical protein